MSQTVAVCYNLFTIVNMATFLHLSLCTNTVLASPTNVLLTYVLAKIAKNYSAQMFLETINAKCIFVGMELQTDVGFFNLVMGPRITRLVLANGAKADSGSLTCNLWLARIDLNDKWSAGYRVWCEAPHNAPHCSVPSSLGCQGQLEFIVHKSNPQKRYSSTNSTPKTFIHNQIQSWELQIRDAGVRHQEEKHWGPTRWSGIVSLWKLMHVHPLKSPLASSFANSH